MVVMADGKRALGAGTGVVDAEEGALLPWVDNLNKDEGQAGVAGAVEVVDHYMVVDESSLLGPG